MRLLIIFLFFISTTIAQDFSEDWTGHFSYNEIVDISEGNGRVYAATDNALFIYDIATGLIETRTTVNGLSGNEVSSIYYSEGFDTLFIGYENGVIDVLVGDEINVLTVVDILNKPSITSSRKRINHFVEFNGFIYISTGFGIALYDVERLEFDDSYFIGEGGALLDVSATAILDDFIYAATVDGGLRRALVNESNIIDFNNWSTTREGSYGDIALLGETLFLLANVNLTISTDGEVFTTIENIPNPPSDIKASDGLVSVTYRNNVLFYNEQGEEVFFYPEVVEGVDRYSTAIALEDSIYIATNGEGLVLFTATSPEEITLLLPNGPLNNNSFGLAATSGLIWSVFGQYEDSYVPGIEDRRGASKFKPDEGWSSIKSTEFFDASDFARVIINPADTSQVYISSFRSGLIEVIDNIPTIIYDENNSTLTTIPTGEENQIRVNGMAFDSSGNLWIGKAKGDDQLHRLSSGGQFTSFDTSSVQNNGNVDELLIAQDGIIYIGTSSSGVIVYNPASDTFASISGNENGANLPNDDVRSIALDRNGSLWIGTRTGLRVLFNPARIFEEPLITATAIIIEEDGLAQELLNGQTITAITIDGANNKWIGTADSGVFLVSPNGQETLFQFNDDNSPLPSNNIQEIVIDPQSGSVYLGTSRGLVAFDGSQTAPAEDLENVIIYPNPVRPNFNGNVRIEGLTARTNVKITDLVGNLVYEENTTGGSIEWDTTAFGRHRVASGVYLVLITGPPGEQVQETKIEKVMIIR